MRCKLFIKQGLWFFLLGALCVAHAGEAVRKNVLFIISDDLNSSLGCWGNSVVKTPNLDALSREGIRFRRAYCQFSVCNPSRASFLTGLRPKHVGVMDNATNFREATPDVVTLPQYFKENGYWTGTIGKTFHEGEKDPQSWSWCADWEVDQMHGSQGSSRNVTEGKLPWMVWRQVTNGVLPDDRIADLAIDRIRGFSKEQPFFLCVGFIRPHDPFFAPKEFFEMYPVESLSLPADSSGSAGIPNGAYGWEPWRKVYEQMDNKWDKKEILQAYYACVSYMDQQVGKILDALKQSGREKDTIIVFLGDNGYHNWEKNWWGKCTVWESGAQVPLIIAGDISSHRNEDCFRVTELLDLCPTVVELCGLPPMSSRDGRSLVPLLENPKMDWRDWKGAAFTRFGSNLLSVRTERWRYCEWLGLKGGEALYDHNIDPEESVNVVSNPEMKETVRRLRKKISEILKQP